jgi:anthranilate 1,2-dioxygenase small subunit
MIIPPETLAELRYFQDEYIAAIDDDRLEDWPGFFLEDALYEIIPRENEAMGLPAPLLRCENAAMMRDRVASLRHANIFEQPSYRHFLSAMIVTGADEAGIRLRTNYCVLNTNVEGSSAVYQTGIYRDVIRRTEAGWRFAEKRVIYDTSRVQTLLAYPI